LPDVCNIGGLAGMGAKYYPTIKDMKASQRFQQKQAARPKAQKPAEVKPVKTDKKPAH
jgi:uncharacterized membrane protein YebE (DUF533 family)